jgi:hypothetical protein
MTSDLPYGRMDHGGTLNIRSVFGTSTRFTATFPAMPLIEQHGD